MSSHATFFPFLLQDLFNFFIFLYSPYHNQEIVIIIIICIIIKIIITIVHSVINFLFLCGLYRNYYYVVAFLNLLLPN